MAVVEQGRIREGWPSSWWTPAVGFLALRATQITRRGWAVVEELSVVPGFVGVQGTPRRRGRPGCYSEILWSWPVSGVGVVRKRSRTGVLFLIPGSYGHDKENCGGKIREMFYCQNAESGTLPVMVAVALAAALGVASPSTRGAKHCAERARTTRDQPCQYEHARSTLRGDSPNNKPADRRIAGKKKPGRSRA